MSKAKPGDGIAIDPLDNGGGVAMALIKAEDGYTRVRLSDVHSQRVLEIYLQDSDVERAAEFLQRCAP